MLRIMGNNNELITLHIQRRNNISSTDYWDGNWLTAITKIKLDSMSTQYTMNIRTDELQIFQTQLINILKTTGSTATLSTMEEGLYLHFILNKLGSITCTGKATIDEKISLNFIFNTDNIQIESIIHQLNQLLVKYPVVGTLS